MKDDAYSLELQPSSLRKPTFAGLNAIEANLQYLILLFPYFSGTVKTDAIGSYGFLELTEVGKAGDGFSVESAIRINKIKITVAGANLSTLSFQGAGWLSESSTESTLVLAYSFDGFMTPTQIQEVLNNLSFTSSADLDSTITLQVSNTTEGDFAPVGPANMIFRGGAIWALVEGKKLTWNAVETAGMTWDDFEAMEK